MKKKDYCVCKAFAAVNTATSSIRLAAGGTTTITKESELCNCQFCQSQRRKRLQTGQQLREMLEAIDREAKQNRQIREQKDREYEKTNHIIESYK
jgi:hypothetical protein